MSVWVANLSFAAFRPLALAFLRHGRFALRFTAASRGGLVLLGLLKAGGLVVSARRMDYERVGSRVDDPHSPRLNVAQGIPATFDTQFFGIHERLISDLAYPDSRVAGERVLINFRKAAAEATERVMDFVEFARYWQRIDELPAQPLVFVLPAAVLANSIPPGWAGEGVEFIHLWDRQHSLLLRLGRGVFRCVAGLARGRRRPSDRPASIGVAVAWGLDRSARLDDLFWWWESSIPAERVVLYFDAADQPASHEIVACADRLGVQCVVVDRGAVGASPHLLWRAAPGAAVSLRRLGWDLRVCAWSLAHGAVGRWVACRTLDMLHGSQQMEDFLVEFNVRAAFHTQDKSMDLLSMACDAVGAARVGHQWSYFAWPQVAIARLHQVYFAWGIQYARMIEAVGSKVDRILLSGCTVRRAHPEANDGGDTQGYRALLTVHGASRVLALFDTSVPCEKFYEFFLRRAIEDPRWGLLIKPKSGVRDLPWLRQHSERRDELESLYQQALATGRVQNLDWRVSPAEAADAADFAVGVDLNSAIVVALLAGRKGICLDYLRVHASPLSRWAMLYHAAPDRLVFDDPERLWRRLNRYFDEPGSDPSLGVADEPVLGEIDPFRDGRAGARIGEYLGWYLEGLDNRLERDAALDAATRRYQDKWGTRSVARGMTQEPVEAFQ